MTATTLEPTLPQAEPTRHWDDLDDERGGLATLWSDTMVYAARNIAPLMEIVRDMEQACPDAWFINFTNPMVRICDAVNRHSKIKVVGLCHQIYAGYGMVGVALAKELGIQVPEGLDGMHADVMQHPLQHCPGNRAHCSTLFGCFYNVDRPRQPMVGSPCRFSAGSFDVCIEPRLCGTNRKNE